MIEVKATAYDAMGREIAFAMGFATRTASAKYAALQGLQARLRGAPELAGKVRRTGCEVL